MRLTVVGCSGSYPGPESPASCYLLEAACADEHGRSRTWRILLDLGNGALGALQKYADLLSIDAVLLSHLHADHCLDLCGYYVVRKYHPTGHQPQIPVWGPQGTADRMARAYDLPPDPGMNEEFEFRDYNGRIELGPFTIDPIPVVHPVPAFALRVGCNGRVLTYSGDTGPCAGLDDAATDADLLLAESSFRARDRNPAELHLTGVECGDVASRMGVRRLVLTHVPPWFSTAEMLDEARTTYAGDIDVAVPGATYEL